MIEESTFDDVHNCQETFRLLLQAISNPGDIVAIKDHAKRLQAEHGVMLTLALTLLDKETSFWIADNEVFAKTVAEITYAKKLANQAGFIFVTNKCTDEAIQYIMAKTTPE
jgi:alpha-D-ribose 1-methylphosphonate 5-triphosphate synthase subunit PhnH